MAGPERCMDADVEVEDLISEGVCVAGLEG